MSITQVQKVAVSSGAGHTQTQGITITGVTAGNTLVAVTGFQNSAGNNGTSATLTSDSNGSWGAAKISVPSTNGPVTTGAAGWVLANANAGSHVLSFDYTADEAFCFIEIIEYTPCTYSTSASAVTANNTSTTVSVVSGALAGVGEMLVACVSVTDAAGGTVAMGITDPPAGWTSVQAYQDEATNQPGQISQLLAAVATSQTATWSWTNTGSAAGVIVALAPPATPTATIAWVV